MTELNLFSTYVSDVTAYTANYWKFNWM